MTEGGASDQADEQGPEQAGPGWRARLTAPLRRFVMLFWAQGEAAIWLWAVLIGIAAGYAALAFRLAIRSVQFASFGVFHAEMEAATANQFWWQTLLVPVAGGIIVAALLWIGMRLKALPEQRAEGVADVIEARAVGKGRMSVRTAAMSAGVAAVSLGAGASAGREGPVVHLGAAVGSLVADGLGLTQRQARTLLACGAAAGIAASFNAPIAGVLFALEVILGHYALRVIAPVSIASLAAAVVADIHLGADVAFTVPELPPASVFDFPASAVLGALAALAAMAFVSFTLGATKRTAAWAGRLHVPLWALPPFGGLLVGALGVFMPEVLGVGYDTVSMALGGEHGVGFLLALMLAKILATALTLGFRFGGGVFSPAMVIGAALGAAFGGLVSLIGLDGGGVPFFGLIGMGAVSGAVLGAPISTTLIVFEMTQSYEAGAAMLVAVSMATVITQSGIGGSFFHKQVERHGWELAAGPQRLILQTVRVRDFMTPVGSDANETLSEGPALYADDSLGRALALLKAEDLDGAAVKRRGGDEAVVGHISRTDALLAYNNALVDAHIERSR